MSNNNTPNDIGAGLVGFLNKKSLFNASPEKKSNRKGQSKEPKEIKETKLTSPRVGNLLKTTNETTQSVKNLQPKKSETRFKKQLEIQNHEGEA